jgi:hypothetical protein
LRYLSHKSAKYKYRILEIITIMLHYEKKTTKKQQQQNLNPACASHISLLIAIILL